jgi:LemA protein
MTGLYILIGILVILVIFIIGSYNSLVQLRQRVQNSWSQVDVQLKRRYDLIPNLVNTVKGYAEHEKSTLERVTEARSRAQAAGSIQEQSQAESILSGALRSLLAVAEAYPDLKANTNFQQLQSDLTETESKIAFARQFYNDTVQKYNTKIEVFPSNIVAGLFKFQKSPYFTLEETEAREAVKVEF